MSCDSVACCWDIVCGGGKEEKKKGVDDFTEGLEYREAAVGSDIDADNMQMLRKKNWAEGEVLMIFFLFFSFFNCCQGTSVAVPVTFPSIGCQK